MEVFLSSLSVEQEERKIKTNKKLEMNSTFIFKILTPRVF
ncbi:hypothetical protein LEP1GSC120_1905 [Leptospira santarosai str. 200702252]|nr:hypothetical protein LEP1GSC130_0996 [Leptospira santarosai str. 200403458]EMO98667.1 hypothetical protein LEP1GSC120_1905 [Leptospira santarosai str. 200702252]